MTGMAFHPVPMHGVKGERRIQTLPEVDILDRTLVGGAPTVALPAMNPTHDAVAQVLAVGVNIDHAGPLERLQRRDRRHQFHSVIGGVRLAALELLLVVAESQNCAPAARPRICLLYTSDAADDLLCVDLGGR